MEGCSIHTTRGRYILAATILASGLTFLFGTAVTIAIPQIQSVFGAQFTEVQWLVNSYALTLGVLILISGSLSDRYGRRKIFLWGTLIFAIGSLLSGTAQTIEILIAYQVLLGVGASMMIPGSLTIINVSFIESERTQAIGLWSGLSAGLAAFGPLLAGVLIDSFGWSSIFYINVPLALLVMYLTYRFVFESKNLNKAPIDIWGSLSIGLALFTLTYGLIQGAVLGWSAPPVIASLVGSVVFLCAFLIIEKKISHPIVPLGVFSRPIIRSANIITLILYFALFGLIFFLNLNLQQVQGYSPSLAGLATLPPIIIIALFSGYAGKYADRIGHRIPMIVGPFLVGVGMYLIARSGLNVNYYTEILPGMILFGAGMTFVIPSLTRSALDVPEEFSGAASGLNNAISRIASLFAVALLGAVALSVFSTNLNTRIENIVLSPKERETVLSQVDRLGGIELDETISTENKTKLEDAIKQSFLGSFAYILYICAFLAFLSSLIAFLTFRKRR